MSVERDDVLDSKERSTHPRGLFPLQGVFEAADGVLNLALNFVGLAIRRQLGVTGRLTDRLLDCAFYLRRRFLDSVLVHDFFLQDLAKPLNGRGGYGVAHLYSGLKARVADDRAR
jgi:hypothetical protein